MVTLSFPISEWTHHSQMRQWLPHKSEPMEPVGGSLKKKVLKRWQRDAAALDELLRDKSCHVIWLNIWLKYWEIQVKHLLLEQPMVFFTLSSRGWACLVYLRFGESGELISVHFLIEMTSALLMNGWLKKNKNKNKNNKNISTKQVLNQKKRKKW